MEVVARLTKPFIELWLPNTPRQSNYQKSSNRFVISVLLSSFAYTCALIISIHLLLPLEPQEKSLITALSSILGSGILLALLTIRFGGQRIAALNIFIATLSAGLALVSMQTGGVQSPINPCVIAIPALATLSIGAVAGAIWSLIVATAAALLFLAANHGYTFTNIISPENMAIAEFSSLLTAASLTLFTIIYFEISSRKLNKLFNAEHHKFITLAHRDSLTGLANRRHFISEIETAIANASIHKGTFCVLYFDLNNFKRINDNLGHHSGDQVLLEFALRLRKLNRSSDLIARLGGDEFCIILPGLNGAEAIRQKIHHYSQTLNAPLLLDNTPYQISASIGYACYPEHGTDYETLLQVADQKMYQVKRGQNTDTRNTSRSKAE
ncbi:diguanylate cyclase domain-containing protein [Zhongshania sp.]|uniref:GGDEF domain-containing protein n=1 Tax=Zhongshania sp. TaxID=1971902 RepID=UPI003568B2FC